MLGNVKIAIDVQGLCKSYGSHRVLRGVRLKVASGSVHALLGSNGAGKSTLVRILSTLIPPDAGRATVAGFDVTRQPRHVRKVISLAGQYAAVDELLTGRENLVLIAFLRHRPHPRAVASRLLERFNLVTAADRRVAGYSGGMRRRLDIAMSLIGNPQVILLDEPTTGLDPEARISVWRTIRMLAHSGVTVLLTTQNLDEAEELADRIAILHNGRIAVDGTLSELKGLLPVTHVEYVRKEPSLQDVFFTVIGRPKLWRGR